MDLGPLTIPRNDQPTRATQSRDAAKRLGFHLQTKPVVCYEVRITGQYVTSAAIEPGSLCIFGDFPVVDDSRGYLFNGTDCVGRVYYASGQVVFNGNRKVSGLLSYGDDGPQRPEAENESVAEFEEI